jgi:hypothetical protein
MLLQLLLPVCMAGEGLNQLHGLFGVVALLLLLQ